MFEIGRSKSNGEDSSITVSSSEPKQPDRDVQIISTARAMANWAFRIISPGPTGPGPMLQTNGVQKNPRNYHSEGIQPFSGKIISDGFGRLALNELIFSSLG